MYKIDSNVNIFFIGIGGIGMSAIAEVLLSMGQKVSGSDQTESEGVKRLISMGAEIYLGHKSSNVENATIVVYSSAIKDSNPEIKRAKELGIPLLRRAEMLAELMRLKHGLAIGGTHGKTTTTSLLATILQESALDPTYIIGGIVKNLNGHARIGKGNVLLAEADESDGSFLLLNPIMSVITNIDLDHMDYYESEENLIRAFKDFANKVPFYGICALNYHDERLRSIRDEMKRPYVFFGTEKGANVKDVDFFAKNIKYDLLGSSFDLFFRGNFMTKIKVNLLGHHNVLNALGAIALARYLRIPFNQISKSIAKFEGIGRRCQLLYSNKYVEVIDDYAHHPTEISTTLDALQKVRNDSKLVVFFEPHRFSRTKDCWQDFFHCFNSADELYLLPIYAASETPIMGVNSKSLVADINRIHPELARETQGMEEISRLIKKGGDNKMTIVTLGAGSIGKKIREIVNDLNK